MNLSNSISLTFFFTFYLFLLLYYKCMLPATDAINLSTFTCERDKNSAIPPFCIHTYLIRPQSNDNICLHPADTSSSEIRVCYWIVHMLNQVRCSVWQYITFSCHFYSISPIYSLCDKWFACSSQQARPSIVRIAYVIVCDIF